jgi:hypothetical protein
MRKMSGRPRWPEPQLPRIKACACSQSIPFTLVPLERPFCTPDDGVYVKRSKLNTPAKLMGKMPRT